VVESTLNVGRRNSSKHCTFETSTEAAELTKYMKKMVQENKFLRLKETRFIETKISYKNDSLFEANLIYLIILIKYVYKISSYCNENFPFCKSIFFFQNFINLLSTNIEESCVCIRPCHESFKCIYHPSGVTFTTHSVTYIYPVITKFSLICFQVLRILLSTISLS